MITIHNLRNEQPKEDYDIRVDRQSCLGNPFYMQEETKRDEVCNKYADWFKIKVGYKEERIYKELERIQEIYERYGKLRLFCWCAPKRCHAETIRRYLLGEQI